MNICLIVISLLIHPKRIHQDFIRFRHMHNGRFLCSTHLLSQVIQHHDKDAPYPPCLCSGRLLRSPPPGKDYERTEATEEQMDVPEWYACNRVFCTNIDKYIAGYPKFETTRASCNLRIDRVWRSIRSYLDVLQNLSLRK